MRLRFAPSPTGSLHLGNARTAIANWLHARAHGGTLVLRVEDTDQARNTPEAERALIADLRWLGIDWDEGPDRGGPAAPYRQSERAGRYRDLLARMLDDGRAYRCFCDPERLHDEREAALARGGDPRYPGTCRALAAAEAERRGRTGESPAIRYRADPGAALPSFVDGLRGAVGAGGELAEDFVLARADGTPLYQFAVVADDHDMAIDHVVRGQDHLSNTPRQILLYRALGWEPPRFTHLPLVLGRDRSRLSKRHGATSLGAMRERGVLPEALLNYLALLGWAPPEEHEVLSPDRLIASWRLDALSPTNVVFDLDKLDWVNQQHLLAMPLGELLERARPDLAAAGLEPAAAGPAHDWWIRALDLVRGRAGTPRALAHELVPLFDPAPAPAPASPEERRLIEALRDASRAGALDSPDDFQRIARAAGKDLGLRGRALFHPIRFSLTGLEEGPELAVLVPLIESGARLALRPPVPSVADRLDRVLEAS